MKYRWIIGKRRRYWNIKGCGDAARFFASNFLFFKGEACGDLCRKYGTNVPHSEMWARHGKT
jgi:hypothetical protein